MENKALVWGTTFVAKTSILLCGEGLFVFLRKKTTIFKALCNVEIKSGKLE